MADTLMAVADKPGSSTAKVVKLDAAQSLAKKVAGGQKPKPSKKGDKEKKRKAGEGMDEDDDSGDESGSDLEFVNVDLDFHGFVEIDFQALKHLLTQLFSHDAKEMDISALADHFLEQEEDVGSCVKSDGEQSDPLAFIGALPWQSDLPYIKTLREYLITKTASKSSVSALLTDSSKRIGIVLQERLVNMPAQVVPQMMRILGEEMQQAGEPFAFTHLLFLSRTFLATTDDLMDEDAPPTSAPSKKKKKKKGGAAAAAAAVAAQTFLYHLEDEVLTNLAEEWTDFEYTNAPKRGQMGQNEDFGVDQRGRIMILETSRLVKAVKDTETLLG